VVVEKNIRIPERFFDNHYKRDFLSYFQSIEMKQETSVEYRKQYELSADVFA